MAYKTVIVQLRDQNDEDAGQALVVITGSHVKREIERHLAGEEIIEIKKVDTEWVAKVTV